MANNKEFDTQMAAYMNEKMEELHIPPELLEPIDEGTPTIEISKAIGFTVNLQGYETARIDTRITIKGKLENKDKVAELVNRELEAEIKKQIDELIEQFDPNRTLLGFPK